MTVGEIMTSALAAAGSATTLAEAARLMREADVGALLVMDGREPAGIVTDRDIVVRAAAEGRDLASTTVSDVMSPAVVSCRDTDTAEAAARTMAVKQIRRLVVRDRTGDVVGVVSLGDVALSTGHAVTGDAFAAIVYRGS
jgi:CBS domain-containing protein